MVTQKSGVEISKKLTHSQVIIATKIANKIREKTIGGEKINESQKQRPKTNPVTIRLIKFFM